MMCFVSEALSKTAQRREQARIRAAERRAKSPEHAKKHAAYMKGYDARRSAVDPEYLPRKRAYVREWHRTSKLADPRWYMLRSAKERARVKGLEFTLTETDLVIPSNCPCCGKAMYFGKRPNPDAPSLDRFDSGQGYTPANLAIICQHCNQVKNAGTAEHHAQIAAWMQRRMGP